MLGVNLLRSGVAAGGAAAICIAIRGAGAGAGAGVGSNGAAGAGRSTAAATSPAGVRGGGTPSAAAAVVVPSERVARSPMSATTGSSCLANVWSSASSISKNGYQREVPSSRPSQPCEEQHLFVQLSSPMIVWRFGKSVEKKRGRCHCAFRTLAL